MYLLAWHPNRYSDYVACWAVEISRFWYQVGLTDFYVFQSDQTLCEIHQAFWSTDMTVKSAGELISSPRIVKVENEWSYRPISHIVHSWCLEEQIYLHFCSICHNLLLSNIYMSCLMNTDNSCAFLELKTTFSVFLSHTRIESFARLYRRNTKRVAWHADFTSLPIYCRSWVLFFFIPEEIARNLSNW